MIRYHKSCSTLSIYAFDKISDTNDFRFLVMDWDEFEEIKIDEELAQGYWKDIFNEYIVLSDDNKITMYYEALSELSYLKARQYTVSKLLERLVHIEDEKMIDAYILELKKWKFKIDNKKPFKDEMIRMFTQLKATNNKINLKESEIKEYMDSGVRVSLIEQVVKLEDATGRVLIDPKVTSIEKWLMIIKNVRVKNKAA